MLRRRNLVWCGGKAIHGGEEVLLTHQGLGQAGEGGLPPGLRLEGFGALAGGGAIGELAKVGQLVLGVPHLLQHLPVLLEGQLGRGVGVACHRTDHCTLQVKHQVSDVLISHKNTTVMGVPVEDQRKSRFLPSVFPVSPCKVHRQVEIGRLCTLDHLCCKGCHGSILLVEHVVCTDSRHRAPTITNKALTLAIIIKVQIKCIRKWKVYIVHQIL